MNSLGSMLEQYRTNRPKAIPNSLFCTECDNGLSVAMKEEAITWVKANRPDLLVLGRVGYMAWCECYRSQIEAEDSKGRMRREANLPLRDDETGPRSFRNFNHTIKGVSEMMKATTEWAKGNGPPVLNLLGITGCGKSHVMEAAGHDMLSRGLSVRYERAGRLLDRLRHTFSNKDSGDIDELFRWYGGFHALLLDDLGMTPPTSWGAGYLTALIDERVADGARLMIATNFASAEELAAGTVGGMVDRAGEGWGDRLATRLFDVRTGTVRVVWCEAANYRVGGQR